MTAAINWDTLAPSAAFVLGAVLSAFAVLRVVRAVSNMFSGDVQHMRRPHLPPGDDHDDDD